MRLGRFFRIRSDQLEVNGTDSIHCRLASEGSLFEENPHDRINGQVLRGMEAHPVDPLRGLGKAFGLYGHCGFGQLFRKLRENFIGQLFSGRHSILTVRNKRDSTGLLGAQHGYWIDTQCSADRWQSSKAERCQNHQAWNRE